MWHIDWLLQLVPKNKRAGIWVVVTLVALSVMLANLGNLQTPHPKPSSVILFFAGLVVGLPAAVIFYYYNNKPKAGYSETDTLDHYYKNEVARPEVTVVSTSQPDEPQNLPKK